MSESEAWLQNLDDYAACVEAGDVLGARWLIDNCPPRLDDLDDIRSTRLERGRREAAELAEQSPTHAAKTAPEYDIDRDFGGEW